MIDNRKETGAFAVVRGNIRGLRELEIVAATAYENRLNWFVGAEFSILVVVFSRGQHRFVRRSMQDVYSVYIIKVKKLGFSLYKPDRVITLTPKFLRQIYRVFRTIIPSKSLEREN